MKTRKQKTDELLRLLNDGPHFSGDPMSIGSKNRRLAAAMASRDFKLWCQTWVIPLVADLVPECRRKETQPSGDGEG